MSKTVCIYHSIDLDGWMSAAIVKHWYEQKHYGNTLHHGNVIVDPNEGLHSLTFIGYNYGQPIPDLSEYDKVIMCDISFPKEEMEKISSKLIWIDHHISAIMQLDTNPLFYNETKGLRDTKFAACELTWKYFFPNEQIPEVVRLLGRYDCFGHKWLKSDEERRNVLIEYTKSATRWMTKEEQDELKQFNRKLSEEQRVLEFQYGARQCISNYEEAYHWLKDSINNTNIVSPEEFIHDIGKSIYRYLCTEAKQTYKSGFPIKLYYYKDLKGRTVFGEFNFICINRERFNPINFGIDYHKDGYEGCACFHYANEMFNFSLYNDNGEVDCSQIAKQFGGGGHKGAAGFRMTLEQFNNLIN